MIKDRLAEYGLKAIHKITPKQLWRRYSQLCQKAGMKSSQFILSFDCDTHEDSAVVWDVHSRLLDLGIQPVYAVPGAELIQGEKQYRKIFETGSEFINHGGRLHTYFDEIEARHKSNFFYHEQTESILKEDIYLGHQTLKSVLGIDSKGFRTPHFGTFQSKRHLNFLHTTLKELNYRFSSSTVPLYGFKYGIKHIQEELYEFPVTGTPAYPFSILDTWGYFAAPDRQKNELDYWNESDQCAELALEFPMLINIYADPSHIHTSSLFFKAMEGLLKRCENTTFTKFRASL